MKNLASLSLLLFVLVSASRVEAQRTVAYDTLADSTPGAVSCGFCAGEKFGMIFRELPGRRGLRPSEFPLTLRSVQIAVASATVNDALMCLGSNVGGTVQTTVEIYAGETAPTSIMALPATGAWPGETRVWRTDEAMLALSVATSAGGSDYDVMFNTLTIDGVMVEPPMTYLRVVVSIPTSPTSTSRNCSLLGIDSPAALGVRDEGRIADQVGFIYAAEVDVGIPGLGIPGGWRWNENVEDMSGSVSGINGDWAIRLDITPAEAMAPDAGPPAMRDAGITDAGTPPSMDAAMPMDDAGMMSGGCTANTDCVGGELCNNGMCERVSCVAASDCAGGQTCVEGRCRNLCSADSDCAGGEVCNTNTGTCIPVVTSAGGGCSAGRADLDSATAPLSIVFLFFAWVAYRKHQRES